MISIIVPCFNESESLPRLLDEILSSVNKIEKNHEVIFVNDGSTDNSQKVLENLHKKYPKNVRIITMRNNFGKASALHAGFQISKGDIIVQLDADLQDDPNELSRFVDKINDGYDVVVGWKQNRKDTFIKNNTSKFFNAITNKISKAKLHDHNCGFKAYKAEAIKGLNLYGELHRYIPVILSNQGYSITEISVHHRPREFGKSKYGPIRFIHGFLDLITVLFITKFNSRPLHLFGYMGIFFFLIGFSIASYLSFVKIFSGQPIGERPLLLFSVMLIILGVQIGITGLVSEQLASLSHRNDPQYFIRKKINVT
jgi:glycosyltransferase involved in cell wall biosynthesis